MLRNWRTVAATATLAGSSAYLYHHYARRSPRPETFEYRVRTGVGPDGKPQYGMQKATLLPMTDVNARLTQLASLQENPRPGGITWKHSTAQLPSNDPIEDAHASLVVEKDPVPDSATSDGDYLLFAVMDGHAGPHTSRLLAKTLIPSIALQLHQLSTSPNAFAPGEKKSYFSFLESIRGLIGVTPPKPPESLGKPSDADPAYVSLAIQNAFALLDAEIVGAPLRIIAEHLAQSKSKSLDAPLDLSQHPMAMPSMLPALSGSCAMLALLDTAHRDLYIACTGDCRAVAGVWEENPDGTGYWRVEVLSEDQTGRNPNELKRLQEEHPGEESTVVKRGRILGGLEPSRAFGDARYKWPLQHQQLLARVFLEGNGKPLRGQSPDFKTPPYVTALPVVTHRKLDFLPQPPATSPITPYPSPSSSGIPYVPLSPPPAPVLNSPALPPPASAEPSLSADVTAGAAAGPSTKRTGLRFLILATDGLWDDLSSRDAVTLVGAHLSGLRAPAISRTALAEHTPTRIGSAGVEGKDKSSSKDITDGADWTFVDPNPSVHLIRNAFGGADTARLRQLLSIPAPQSRRFRDDVTVTVVWWEDGRGGEIAARHDTLKLSAAELAKVGEPLKAKAKL